MLGSEQRARLLLLAAGLAGFLLFWWAGSAFDIPEPAAYGASLLLQPAPVVSMLVPLVLVAACTLLGAAIAGRVRIDAGAFAAAAGLLALSMRDGPVGEVLLGAPGPGVFATLAVELGALLLMMLVAWTLQRLLAGAGWLRSDIETDRFPDLDDAPATRVQALAVHALATALIVGVIAQTDQKAQVLAAVLTATFLASLLSFSIFPVQDAIWLWASPFVVGMIGYLWAWRSSEQWMIGDVGDFLGASLARALPLDWAGAGVVGTLAGYWMARRWMRAREMPEAAATGG